MRVIRTEMYFDASEIQGLRANVAGTDNPGLAFAWLKFTAEMRITSGLENVAWLQNAQTITRGQVGSVLDLLLRQEIVELPIGVPAAVNKYAVEYLFAEDIILEHSPPFAISVKGLLDSTNLPIIIGSYLGWDAAQDHVTLLFITIPAGIVAVSSAIGIGKALERGLNKKVSEFFDTRKGPPTPTRST